VAPFLIRTETASSRSVGFGVHIFYLADKESEPFRDRILMILAGGGIR